jgi:hypothetical protein
MAEADPRLISGEHIVYTTRKHWASLVTDSLWAIAMVVGSLVLAWVQPDSNGAILGFVNRVIDLLRLGLFLGGCGWFVYNIVAWRTAEYTVTNLRVLGHEGLVRRRSTDTLLGSISDLRTVIPALGGLLGFGHIRIITAGGEAGSDTFTGVRDAQGFKRNVMEQKAAQSSRADGGLAQTGVSVARPSSVSWQDANVLLGQLANLRDVGVLTPDEYEVKKAVVLGVIGSR